MKLRQKQKGVIICELCSSQVASHYTDKSGKVCQDCLWKKILGEKAMSEETPDTIPNPEEVYEEEQENESRS